MSISPVNPQPNAADSANGDESEHRPNGQHHPNGQRRPMPSEPDLGLVRAALAQVSEVAGGCNLESLKLLKPNAVDWRAIAIAELRQTLDAVIVTRFAEDALEALYQNGCFDVWLPEVATMVGFGDGEWRHKDVWLHTKQVVKQSVPRLEVRWGALLHDIGKPRTRRFEEGNRVTFHGHSEVGAKMFRKKVGARLGFEGALYDRIHFLILHHLRAAQYEASWTDAAVRRFYKQMGDGLTDLFDLSRADITTKRPEKRKRGVKQIAALKQRVEALKSEDNKVRPLPKGLGLLVAERFDIPPSKRLGNLMKDLETDAEEGLVAAGAEFEVYLDYIECNRERFDLDG